MLPRRLLVLGALAGCQQGEPPDLIGLADQVAVVGQLFTLQLDAEDPDGDALVFRVRADFELDDSASVTQLPSGSGLFRWTPLAADVGSHAFDFTVSDGNNATTVSINIDVRATAGGIPIFRQPLGAGRVVMLATTPCIELDILIEDQDTAQVTIGEDEPRIAGTMFSQLDGTTAHWKWCPTPAQAAESDRYTLVLYADDGEHPKTVKNYVIVLAGSAGPNLVLNEVDYDNVGTDNAEYIELFNPSGSPTSLAGRSLILVNGATNEAYANIDLSPLGTLAAGQYLVVAGENVDTTAPRLDPLWTTDEVQNGPADGIALVDDVAKVVIDALSYEGGITAVMLPGFPAAVTLVEGTVLDPTVADSNTVNRTLCRDPSHADTNNNAADWILCANRTAGTANAP